MYDEASLRYHEALPRNEGIICVGKGGQAKALTDVVDSITSYSVSRQGKLTIAEYVDYDDLEVEPERTYVIGFGSLKNLKKRQEVAEQILDGGGKLGVVVAPTAYVSPQASLAPGTVVMHNAYVGPGVVIGENVLINSGAVVEHDSVIGNHSLILTNSTVNGQCVIGDRCMIGSTAVLLHGVVLAHDVILGAGAVAIRSLTSRGTYVGCPARRLR